MKKKRIFKNVKEKTATTFHAFYKKHEVLINFIWRYKVWSVQIWDKRGCYAVDAGLDKDEYPTIESAIEFGLKGAEL